MGGFVDFVAGCALVTFVLIGIAGGPCCWILMGGLLFAAGGT